MAIYQDKEKKTKDGRSWYFKISYKDLNGNKKRFESKRYATKSEAKQQEAIYLLSINKVKKDDIKINELFENFISEKEKVIKPQSLIKLKKYYENHIKSVLGNLEVNKIDNHTYLMFKKELDKKQLTSNYKNKLHQLVKSIFKFGIKFYNIEKNIPEIVGGFENSKNKIKEMDFFTLEEYKLFKSNINNIVWITYFDLLYYCGLRKNEANALNWDDIDFQNKTININKNIVMKIKGVDYKIDTPKTRGSNRILPLTNLLLYDLQQLLKYQKSRKSFKKSWFIFGGIKPLSETTITNKKNEYCKLANLKQIRVHDFRHSCASLLINNGANITLVAKYLGHSDIQMTLNTYTHLYKSKLDELANTLNELE